MRDEGLCPACCKGSLPWRTIRSTLSKRTRPRCAISLGTSDISGATCTHPTVIIDLDAVVDASPVSLACALQACKQVWDVPEDAPLKIVSLPTDLYAISLEKPEHAVFLVKLLLDELLIGPQQRASGTRRTRPFRLAEISALWGEELLSVCLSRWALTAQSTTSQLATDTQTAWLQAVNDCDIVEHNRCNSNQQPSPHQHPDAPTISSTSTAASAAVLLPQANGNQEQEPVQGAQGRFLTDEAQPLDHVVNVLTAAQCSHTICVTSTWPANITSALLRRCGLLCKPWSAEENSSTSPLGTQCDLNDLPQTPGLYEVSGTGSWEQALSVALGPYDAQTSSRSDTYIITASTARAEQARALCDARRRPASTQVPHEMMSGPARVPQVFLADWCSSSPAVRARALSRGLSLVDNVELVNLFGLTDSRLVMDGIVW